MAGRLDPPHERVTLTLSELRRLAALERVFTEEAVYERPSPVAPVPAPAPAPAPYRRRGRLRRWWAAWVDWLSV